MLPPRPRMHSGGGDRDFRAQLLRCDTCKEARKKCTYNVEECAETARTFESNGLPRRKGTERESHDGKTRMTRGFTSGAGRYEDLKLSRQDLFGCFCLGARRFSG